MCVVKGRAKRGTSHAARVTKNALCQSGKLRLDYVIEKLSGKSGLLEIASAVRKVCTDVTEDTDKPLEVNSLYDTIEYLQSLTAFLPNQQQATALERETAKILEKL